MKKIKKFIVITILMMILFLLGTSVVNKVQGAITGAPGVGVGDDEGHVSSLTGNHCCQEGKSLWSSNIESDYKKWYLRDLPYGEIEATVDREITSETVCDLLSNYAATGFGGVYTLGSDDYFSLVNDTIGLREGERGASDWFTYRNHHDYHVYGSWTRYDVNTSIWGVKLDPYVLKDHGWGDAAETYIANHWDGYYDGGSPGQGQKLWWQTAVGQSRNGGTSNVNDPIVNEWESFIRRATGQSNPKCTENGFDIKFEPKWNTDGIYKNPKAVYNADSDSSNPEPYYVIGPFSINYIDGGRFSYIKDMKVYTDASKESVEASIVGCDNIKNIEGEDGNNYNKYPAPNTKFYIKIKAKDIVNATKITNIHFDFEYWNGYVEYYRYDSNSGYEITELSLKLFKFVYFYYDYFIQNGQVHDTTLQDLDVVYMIRADIIEQSNEDAQSLAEVGNEGSVTGGGRQAWWATQKSLDRKVTTNKATIQVEKIIKGENGETLSLADLNLDENSCPSFDFEIKVTGASNSGTEIVSVKPGETVTSKVYEWKGDTAPTYTVKELNNSKNTELGYEIGDITLKYESSTGGGTWDASSKTFSGSLPSEGNIISLSDGNEVPSATIHLSATNKKRPDSGDDDGCLRIVKIFKDYDASIADGNQHLLKSLEDKANSLKNKKYKFDVRIYGNFECFENGVWKKYTNSESGFVQTVDVSVNEPWVAPNIRWYGEPPRYIVTEHIDETGETSIVSITPNSGTDPRTSEGVISKNQTIIVTAENEVNVEKAKLQIIKMVDFTGYIPLDPSDPNKERLKRIYAKKVKEHIFKFKIDVENYYGYESGNQSMEIDVPGTLGVWEEKDGKIYFVITKTIEEEFMWVKGNSGLRYKIEELADDKTTFQSVISNGIEINVSGKIVSGRLNSSNTDLTAEIQNIFINEVIDPEYSLKAIELFKIISDEDDLKNKDYKFKVILKGKAFYYNEKLYASDDPDKDIVVQLTNLDGEESSFEIVNEEKYSTSKVVTIRINDGELIKSWASEKISWCTFVEAPTYEVEELTQGTEIEESIQNNNNRVDTAMKQAELIELLQTQISNIDDGYEKDALTQILNKVKSVTEEEYNKNRSIFIIAKNTLPTGEPKIKEGKIGIIKRLENQNKLSEDDIKRLEFTFKIDIERSVPYEVTLKYNEDADKNNLYKIGDEYVWIYTTNKIVWNEDENAPNYTIEEIGNKPDDIKTEFVEMSAIPTDSVTTENKKISGVINEELIKNEDKPEIGGIGDEIQEDSLIDITNLVTVKNTIDTNNDSKEGSIIIDKQVTDGTLVGKNYSFSVTITGNYNYPGKDGNEKIEDKVVTVIGGEKNVIIDNIVWYGEAPTYEVKELPSDISEPEGTNIWTGTLENKSSANINTIVATNGSTDVSGGIKILKTVQGGSISGNEEYEFKVEIEGKSEYTVKVRANETVDLGKYTWKKSDEPPKYKITEINIPEGSEFVSIEAQNGTENKTNHSIEGSLISEDTVEVTCINTIDGGDDNKGRFTVEKVVSKSLKGGVDISNKTFTVNMTISGTFDSVIDGQNISRVNGAYTFTKEIKANSSYTSPEIKWYGDNVPTITVSEDLDVNGDDIGWRLLGISNNNVQLKKGNSTVITITNELPEYTTIDLTLELAGKVWEDRNTDTKGAASNANGWYDNGENLISGVEVYVYKNYIDGRRELATIFDNYEGAVINQPIITDKNGHWDAPRVKISDEGYLKDYEFDVEFMYDGQTYEPTKFLELSTYRLNKLKEVATGTRLEHLNDYSNITNATRARLYKNTSTNRRDYFSFSSMALDANRLTVNNRIAEVKGLTAIDGAGNTTGIAVSSNGNENYIYYKAKNPGTNNSRVVSELQTLNSDGTALDLFKATARTSVGGLTYAFDDKFVINNSNVTIGKNGMNTHFTATATYNYCLNINLGLTKRQEADLEAQKDLVSADIIVNDKRINYEFNKLKDKTVGTITRTGIEGLDAQNITYTLGLYKTDFYYRAEMYKTSANYEEINKFYKDIYGDEGIDATNLEIYLHYKITLYNGSSSIYIAQLNSIEDYYESSLELVEQNINKYIKNASGEDIVNHSMVEIAKAPYYKSENGNFTYDTTLRFDTIEKNIMGSDGITYNKSKVDLSNLGSDRELKSGEKLEIYATFKADAKTIKEAITGINEYKLKDNQKSNIVEISSYTIYRNNENKRIEGKIDKDSAPSNVDIINRNEKSWYEEDTDEAPRLELGFIENGKTVTGTVWEDAKNKYNYGKYDEGNEALIGGLTTQLVEKIKIQNNNTFTDYDFVWPTNVPLNDLGGRTIEGVTGFSSTVETSRIPTGTDEDNNPTGVGEYRFESVPTGNYVIRFLYGNNKLALDDTSKITGDPEALDNNGNKFLQDEKYKDILTANYDLERVGRTPVVYNGQDYQSTAYKYGQTGLIQNEWEDISESIGNNRLSDARDSEPRRLELIANSQTITNVNGEVLGSANNKYVSHNDLYDTYYMYADTAKLNLNYDNLNESLNVNGQSYNKEITSRKYANSNSVDVNVTHNDYSVTKIDFGLVERPETTLVLDKEISEIKITTNDGNVIFDGIYHTNYNLVNDSNLDKYQVKSSRIIYKKGTRFETEYLVAETILDKDNSIGIDALQAINKEEQKLSFTEYIRGVKNFRYINIEERVLQGTTIEIKYNMRALNVSEEDYTSEILSNINKDGDKIRSSSEIKSEILKLAKESYKNSYSGENIKIISNEPNSYKIGTYLGKYYYRHDTPDDNDKIVTSKVRQIIDYIDNDAEFSDEYNSDKDHSWKATTYTELSGNGIDDNRLLRKDILAYFEITDKSNMDYITKDYSNLVLSIDSQNNDSDSMQNNGFEKELEPCFKKGNKQDLSTYSSLIGLTITKAVSAEDDADNLAYDNLTEIVKFENTVGRRNVTAIPGNCNPKELHENEPIGEFAAALKEIDSSATELITFIPPTGIETEKVINTELLIVVVASLTIISIGIVVIKKKILK